MGALTDRTPPLRLAIVGGGFTGAALATHALTSAAQLVSVDVIEPSAKLGRGAAYGTIDRDHRINVPSDRMSLFSADPSHFTRWLFDNKWLPDAESVDALGRCYAPRSAFAAYVEDTLAQTGRRRLGRASLRHRRSRAVALARENQGFRVELANGVPLHVDRVAICTGYVPGAPCRVWERATRHPRFIANPWAVGSLAAVRQSDNVLIAGTGLTMVDVVATLARRDCRGPIVAVSPRGLLPCAHDQFVDGLHLFEDARPRSALELLRLIRATVRQRDGELDWQSIVDALCRRLPQIWPTLPPRERLCVVRRLLPFWEVHRFRIAPQAAAEVSRLSGQGTLILQRAKAIEVDARDGSLVASLRLPGGRMVERVFDAVIICSGASRSIRDNPLLDNLVDQGLAQADDVNFGVRVDEFSRLLDARAATQPDLFAFGPITRGTFGEMSGAPDIVRQIERVIPRLIEATSPVQSAAGLEALTH
jgi:uncharacterized NAD(P)/FAD-binding protein YdhS